MLTDIFSNRYGSISLWATFEETDRRFLVQAFRIIEEQVYPYYVDGNISQTAKQKWERIHSRMSMELGLKELSPRYYSYQSTFNGRPHTRSGFFEWNFVCEKFVYANFDGTMPADHFMKERISFFEIAFREFYEDVQKSNDELPNRILDWRVRSVGRPRRGLTVPKTQVESDISWPELQNNRLNERYRSAVEELNARMRHAGYPLQFHNGFFQIAKDEFVASEIEQPFWSAVADPVWKNVDIDIKEAVHRRDTGQRDPAFYAARALESAIKIISDQKGWTHGGEKGAHNYLDNLGGAKNGAFVASWEKKALKEFFSAVRNPFAHAPGSADMPELTPIQTDCTIELCMAWIKSLIKRM